MPAPQDTQNPASPLNEKPFKLRLLIADGYGSHIRADFIAYYMENNIHLFIMPPHCSHVLQPLDMGVFSVFKRYFFNETDALSRLNTQRIPRVEWMKMFMAARKKAVTIKNILRGWKGAGLMPFNSIKILNRLSTKPPPAKRPIHTPTNQTDLNLSLLHNSPPDGTELRQSNKKFTDTLRKITNESTPIARYADRMTRIYETQNATIALMAQQLKVQSELLHKRKSHKKGKRVKLKDITAYSTQNVLNIAREAEIKKENTGPKRPRGRPRKRPIEEIEEISEDNSFISLSTDSDIVLEDCVGRRTRARMRD